MDSQAPRPIALLVVEDDFDLLPYLVESLSELSDFVIHSATDGAKALERFYEVRPDCLLVDVKMPLMDGLQLVRALRGDPETADTPIVMLTAMAQDKDRFFGLAAGADRYLLKPTKIPAIIAAVREAVAINAADRDRRYREFAERHAAGDQ